MIARSWTGALFAFLLAAAPVAAQSGPYPPEFLAPFRAIAAKASESTVRVQCDDTDSALGTVISADGFILTKASELRGAVTIVLADGTAHDVSIVGVHPETDLALLKVDLRKANADQLKPVKFADSKKVPVGNWLVASGTTSDPVGVGIVSVKTRDLTGEEGRDRSNYNRGALGVELDEEKGVKGARVAEIRTDSGAKKAGLKKDDLITELNGKPVKDPAALIKLLGDYRKGDKVKLKVLRDEKEMDFQVTLGERELDRSEIQNRWGSKLSGRRYGFPAILQTDMVVNADKCGGPVLDLEGNVLGISIARAGRVETWVLPSEVIRPLLADLKAGKYAPEAKKPSK